MALKPKVRHVQDATVTKFTPSRMHLTLEADEANDANVYPGSLRSAPNISPSASAGF
ncbi:hCG1818404 [Homo sapiens]